MLSARGHAVRALVRPGSRPPDGADVVAGNALDAATYAAHVAPADTFVHLVGVAHPGPGKGEAFRAVDLRSIQAAVAAIGPSVRHFVYLSVAQPAPIMGEYIEVRREGERLVTATGRHATFLRPWYVVGPGHWWPLLLLPVYWMVPRHLGLVTLSTMVGALVNAVENPPAGVRVWDVPALRAAARAR